MTTRSLIPFTLSLLTLLASSTLLGGCSKSSKPGTLGPQGSTGQQGATGQDGGLGPQGPSGGGPVGATGATGATGAVGAAGATGGVGPVASSATFASVSSAVLIDLFIADYVVPADRDLLILSYGGEDGNGTLAIDGVPAYQFGGVLLEGPVPIPAGVTLSLVTQVVPRRKLRFMGVLTTEDEAVFITLTPATPYVVPAGKTLFIYTTRTPAPASGGGITELLLDGVEYQTFPNNDKRNYPSQMVIPPGVTLSVPAFILRFTGRLR